MKLVPMHSIETQRLLLRSLQMTDLESYFNHLTSDPEVGRHMLQNFNPDISNTEATLARRIGECGSGRGYHWTIIRKTDDAFLGTISLLRFEEETGTCSFAYMLGKAFWGQGYGTEALRAVLDFAFREMELSEVSADHFAQNPASGAVMAKAGMRQTGLVPRKYEKNGEFHDAVSYAITREEWLANLT